MRAGKAIEEIAEKEGKTVEEVRAAIQEAMDEAMQSKDLKVQAMWRMIPCAADRPTPEEFIEYISYKVVLDRQK